MGIKFSDGNVTMSFSTCTSKTLKLSLAAFALSFTAYCLFSRPEINRQDYHDIYRVAVSGKKGAFVQSASTTEIDGPFDDTTLVALCNSRTWTPGLIFKCEAPKGGIGNVRNIFLNCLRYAIEAGATGFVVPEVMGRGTTLATIHIDTLIPFTHYFDFEHFTHSLSGACPQIHLYSHSNDLWDKPSVSEPVLLFPEKLDNKFVIESVLAAPGNWTASFKHFLNTTYTKHFSAEIPVLVSVQKPLLQFPLSYDDSHLVANFGKLLRFREDIRRLAATVLFALNKKYNLDTDPDEIGIHPGKFYGAHLRTAPNAKAAGWTPYSIQSTNYIHHASTLHILLIYLATGNEADALSFTSDAANKSIVIETKESLLRMKGFENEMRELGKLSWDQKVLVDYEVLLRASAFGGTHESSFSWNLAMRRHVVVGKGSWMSVIEDGSTKESREERFVKNETPAPALVPVVGEVKKVGMKEEKDAKDEAFRKHQSFKDPLSIVFGPPGEGKLFELSMWP